MAKPVSWLDRSIILSLCTLRPTCHFILLKNYSHHRKNKASLFPRCLFLDLLLALMQLPTFEISCLEQPTVKVQQLRHPGLIWLHNTCVFIHGPHIIRLSLRINMLVNLFTVCCHIAIMELLHF
jgi:hypothetical protein